MKVFITPKVCQLCGMRFAKPCLSYAEAAQCSIWRSPECKSRRALLTSHIINTMNSEESLTGPKSNRLASGVLSTKPPKVLLTKTTPSKMPENKSKQPGSCSELITSSDPATSKDRSTTSLTGPSPTETCSSSLTTRTKDVQSVTSRSGSKPSRTRRGNVPPSTPATS